jgi:hypothetical protein
MTLLDDHPQHRRLRLGGGRVERGHHAALVAPHHRQAGRVADQQRAADPRVLHERFVVLRLEIDVGAEALALQRSADLGAELAQRRQPE